MSSEQQALSDVIKGVHRRLRQKLHKTGDVNQVWRDHCSDEKTLQEYAAAMKSLAEDHWSCLSNHDSSTSRITWVITECERYFNPPNILSHIKRELYLAQKYNLQTEDSIATDSFNFNDQEIPLLDVGSCFNPFCNVPRLKVLAVDIAPAVNSVRKCDFLNLEICRDAPDIDDVTEIKSLQIESFLVVVFSLLLEYFPSPTLRYRACRNAYELLKPNGVLAIITPDSKHQGANARMMKSWRLALGMMGFIRVSYEKLQHLHCMLFRKSVIHCVSVEVMKRDVEKFVGKSPNELALNDKESMMFIPQDFHDYSEEPVNVVDRTEEENLQVAKVFATLPEDL